MTEATTDLKPIAGVSRGVRRLEYPTDESGNGICSSSSLLETDFLSCSVVPPSSLVKAPAAKPASGHSTLVS